jgi:hypothetical protein
VSVLAEGDISKKGDFEKFESGRVTLQSLRGFHEGTSESQIVTQCVCTELPSNELTI